MTQDINVLALVKGEERYIFLFDDEHRSPKPCERSAALPRNPELSFSWYDAAVLSQRIRQTAQEARAEERSRRRRSCRSRPQPAVQAAAAE